MRAAGHVAPGALVALGSAQSVFVDTGMVVGHPEFQRKCLAGYDTVDMGLGRVSAEMRLSRRISSSASSRRQS